MPFQFVELFCVFCSSSSARRVQIKDNNNLSIFYYTFQTSAVINKNKSKMLVVYHLKQRFLKTNPSPKMCFEFVRKILPIIPTGSLAVSSFKKCIDRRILLRFNVASYLQVNKKGKTWVHQMLRDAYNTKTEATSQMFIMQNSLENIRLTSHHIDEGTTRCKAPLPQRSFSYFRWHPRRKEHES